MVDFDIAVLRGLGISVASPSESRPAERDSVRALAGCGLDPPTAARLFFSSRLLAEGLGPSGPLEARAAASGVLVGRGAPGDVGLEAPVVLVHRKGGLQAHVFAGAAVEGSLELLEATPRGWGGPPGDQADCLLRVRGSGPVTLGGAVAVTRLLEGGAPEPACRRPGAILPGLYGLRASQGGAEALVNPGLSEAQYFLLARVTEGSVSASLYTEVMLDSLAPELPGARSLLVAASAGLSGPLWEGVLVKVARNLPAGSQVALALTGVLCPLSGPGWASMGTLFVEGEERGVVVGETLGGRRVIEEIVRMARGSVDDDTLVYSSGGRIGFLAWL